MQLIDVFHQKQHYMAHIYFITPDHPASWPSGKELTFIVWYLYILNMIPFKFSDNSSSTHGKCYVHRANAKCMHWLFIFPTCEFLSSPSHFSFKTSLLVCHHFTSIFNLHSFISLLFERLPDSRIISNPYFLSKCQLKFWLLLVIMCLVFKCWCCPGHFCLNHRRK